MMNWHPKIRETKNQSIQASNKSIHGPKLRLQRGFMRVQALGSQMLL